ncbi:hypothetical protein [Pedobacter nototheniae]|uniref:hypothetical protein n=1 Tax=Pedobacter nototheniae TaxID=2488994 RepID=UPI00103B853F|nr:hypothetical protein [Pedobacter nototheniae]
MVLTAQQTQKLKDYIFSASKYRETYNEIYDHILNALADQNEPYSIELVSRIVHNDFGDFKEIRKQERLYQQQINKKYARLFRLEIANSFKWPGLLSNLTILALCICLYYGSKSAPFNMKPITIATFLCFAAIAVFVYSKIILSKRKNNKYSVMDNSIGSLATIGLFIGNFVLYWFITKDSLINLSYDYKIIAMLILFFFCSVYVRAFIKFYNQKIKILTI